MSKTLRNDPYNNDVDNDNWEKLCAFFKRRRLGEYNSDEQFLLDFLNDHNLDIMEYHSWPEDIKVLAKLTF